MGCILEVEIRGLGFMVYGDLGCPASSLLFLSEGFRVGGVGLTAAERKRNNLNGFEEFLSQNGSNPGHNLASTSLCAMLLY